MSDVVVFLQFVLAPHAGDSVHSGIRSSRRERNVVGVEQRAFDGLVLLAVTNMLESSLSGASGRASMCASVAALFDCVAVAHAVFAAEASSWSVCLWRQGPTGTRTVT